MVTRVVHCQHCESDKLVKNGHAPNGKQKYRCKGCGRSGRENAVTKGYAEKRKEEILKAYQERSSMRGLTRTFGVSRTTVAKFADATSSQWLKKSRDDTTP